MSALITEAGGRIVQESVLEEIAYHGLLVELPAGEVENLIAQRNVALVMDDDVMFLRPQSVLQGPFEMEAITYEQPEEHAEPPLTALPIAALFDGVPVQVHSLLSDRLIIDDPDDLESRVVVAFFADMAQQWHL